MRMELLQPKGNFGLQTFPEARPIATSPIDYLKDRLPTMPKWEMEKLMKATRVVYMNRFKRRKTPKYGNLNKGFTEPQLKSFLLAIDNPKLKLLFEYQANLGLRVGEVVKVNIKDINLETRELTIRTEKANRIDTLIIPLPLFRTTIEHIQTHKAEIEHENGYIFFKDRCKNTARKEGWLEPNYVRNKFREYLQLASLDETYDISEEQGARTPRKLHRLTTHSLRHYAITRFARTSNGNIVLTSHFARHSSTDVISVYINTDKKEVYDVIDSIAVSEVALIKKRITK